MSDEPLIPGPLYGLRTWRVAVEDGVEHLAAPHRGTPWPAGGEWLEAGCERLHHAAPAADCDCGVHAWHPSRANARQVLASRRDIVGIVEADGATEVHREGFRAERARPYALVFVPGRNRSQIDRLARAYHVDVAEVSGADALLAWCTERGLGLSAAVVERLVPPEDHARRRNGALRLAAALAVAALLVLGGLQLIPEQEHGKVLHGRTGEIRTP